MMSVNRNPNPQRTRQGVPSAVIFLLVIIIVFDFITRRTKFGRYIFAVGGNAEAARRAGINVDRIRIIVFVLCFDIGGARRHPGRLAAVRRQPILGQRRRAAQRHRRGSDRRHQPVWRARQHLVGAAGRPGDRLDRQRHGFAGVPILDPVYGHRRGTAAGSDSGRLYTVTP